MPHPVDNGFIRQGKDYTTLILQVDMILGKVYFFNANFINY